MKQSLERTAPSGGGGGAHLRAPPSSPSSSHIPSLCACFLCLPQVAVVRGGQQVGLERLRSSWSKSSPRTTHPHGASRGGGCLLPGLYRHLPLNPFLLFCEMGVTGWAQGCSRKRGSLPVYAGVGPWAGSLKGGEAGGLRCTGPALPRVSTGFGPSRALRSSGEPEFLPLGSCPRPSLWSGQPLLPWGCFLERRVPSSALGRDRGPRIRRR